MRRTYAGATALLLTLGGCMPAMQMLENASVVAQTASALAQAKSRGGRCGAVQPLPLAGAPLADTFTVEDCSVEEYGDRHLVKSYGFTAAQVRDVHFVVDAPGLNIRLTLFQEDGTELKRDDYTGAFTFLSTQVAPGTYRLELRSTGDNAREHFTGRFTLRSSTDETGFEGCATAPLALGKTVPGEWSVSDCRQAVNTRWQLRYFDYYLLEIPSARNVTITLTSPGINSEVALFSRDGTGLKEEMAFGEPGTIRTQLAPGQYVVRVGVASVNPDRETGRYTLSAR